MNKTSVYDKPKIAFKNTNDFRKWLEINHDKSNGFWMILYKKDSKKETIQYTDAVDEALCFGWIDSFVNKYSNGARIQYFAPRKPKSVWSGINKGKIERLIKDKRMAEPGLLKVEQAKKDGSWTLLDDVEALIIPEDLKAELKKYNQAATHFNNFSNSQKKMILWWIKSAGTDETRKKRIDETVSKSALNIKVR